MSLFSSIKSRPSEVKKSLPGDDIIPSADVVMDRAFSLSATPSEVWPWFEQLGKNRAGWYFPSWVERFMTPKKRALRFVDSELQDLKVGKIIDDWGGKNGYFEVAILDAPHTLVHKSTRGKISMSWAITLWPERSGTRVIIRLRLAPVRTTWVAKFGGGFIDALTIAGLAAGLKERLLRK